MRVDEKLTVFKLSFADGRLYLLGEVGGTFWSIPQKEAASIILTKKHYMRDYVYAYDSKCADTFERWNNNSDFSYTFQPEHLF